MNKKILIPAIALSVLGFVVAYGTGKVAAQTTGRNGLMDRIVERFNLNEDEVDATIEEYRNEKREQNWSDREAKLQQAVEDGVITAEQKQMLINKHQEMWEERGQHREEMQKWMEESGINFEALREYGCGMMGQKMGRGFGIHR